MNTKQLNPSHTNMRKLKGILRGSSFNHKRASYLRLFGLLVLGIAFCLPALAVSPPARVDDDHDGIDDNVEQRLAELYAPLLYIEPDESNYPVTVEWYLARTHLEYHEDCGNDTDEPVGPNPIGTLLLGSSPGVPWQHGPDCGTDDCDYQNPPHRWISTLAADPDGQFCAGSLTTGYSDQQTFDLADLPASVPGLPPGPQLGSTDPHDWVTYFHAYPTFDGGIMIQYWHFFAYNQFGGLFDDHGGDWDASIQVRLDKNLNLVGVWFSRHLNDHPGDFFAVPGANVVRFFNNTHPVVTIDGGGHAAFRSPNDWSGCNCRVGESVTGPIGTIVWTLDSDAYDNPAALRKVDYVCEAGTCVTGLESSTSGGIVWETWTHGAVVSSGNLTNPITSPSISGGLVNLGEYNPCVGDTCVGSRQASTLLAGEFHPLNNDYWLPFEGRWGSVGSINSGPRDPVFQGFEDRGSEAASVYRAWYNEGANSPATNDGSHPWLVPPATTATVGGPSVSLGGSTFVLGSSNITLQASQSSAASTLGALTTYYRFYPSGGAVPPFDVYGVPFGLHLGPSALADGVYKVEYYSVDGAGNSEATHTLTLTLDNTAPVVSIVQPHATTYAHNSTLNLSYSVSDGSGSGVHGFTAKLDGAATLAGHGLASGQLVDLLTEMTLGSHTFVVNASDNLGNARVASVTFQINVTPQSIKDDVARFAAMGKLKNSGEANSLTVKLNAAADAMAKGNCKEAGNNYNAFMNELQAQRGKGVDAAAADVMLADAQYMIAHCP